MDWTTYFNGFWMFPLFCLLFMAIMMLACGVLRRGCGHGAACRGRDTACHTAEARRAPSAD